MSNLQNRNPNNRQVPPNNDGTDPNQNVAYRDGYLHGRVSERRIQEESQQIRDNDNSARGLLIGIALASLVGLTIGAIFLFSRRQETPAPAPVIAPVVTPEVTQTPQPEKTIIQRETRVEQVPVAPSPTATITPLPRVNITVPPQPTPRVTVTVPPQPAPRVNVDVPPQPAPSVNINVPERPASTSGTSNTTINVTPPQTQNQNPVNNSGTNTTTSGSDTNPNNTTNTNGVTNNTTDTTNPNTGADSGTSNQ